MTVPTQERPARELAPRPAIDPRMRERRIEVIRAAGRRRLHVTLVIASTIVVVGLAYLTVRSPLLDLDHIRITGSRREPVNEILRAAHVRTGEALLLLDTGAVARRVEKLPWVERARVRRELPGTLSITVTEYVPTAYVRTSANMVALIASTGRVVALSRSAPHQGVQVLGDHQRLGVGASLVPRRAADVLRQLPPHLRPRVAAVDVGGAGVVLDLRAAAPAGSSCRGVDHAVPGFEQVRLGTFDALRDKGVAALSVLNQLTGRSFTYVDVSVPQAPVSC